MPTTDGTLPVRFTGKYSLMEIPPRCRKLRPVPYEADFTLKIRSVTGQQAPVALSYPAPFVPARDIVLRFYDHQLYRPVTHHVWPDSRPGGESIEIPTAYDTDRFPANAPLRTSSWGTVESLETVIAEHEGYLAPLLVIDGFLWTRAIEPRYVITADARRYKHAASQPRHTIHIADEDKAHDDARHIFRADQRPAALADLAELFRRDGMDQGAIVELVAEAPLITVHVPAAVRLVVPEQEPKDLADLRTELQQALYEARDAMGRIDRWYAAPERNQGIAREFADAWQRMTDTHVAITALTDDVVGADAVRRPYVSDVGPTQTS